MNKQTTTDKRQKKNAHKMKYKTGEPGMEEQNERKKHTLTKKERNETKQERVYRNHGILMKSVEPADEVNVMNSEIDEMDRRKEEKHKEFFDRKSVFVCDTSVWMVKIEQQRWKT